MKEVVETLFKNWAAPPAILIDEAKRTHHETSYLSVSIHKASLLLGWRPVWGFSRAMAETSAWYQAWLSDRTADLAAMAGRQIEHFEADAAHP